MSARRAVLLTLGVVAIVLALVAGLFLGYRKYDDVRDRADKAERELAAVRNRPPDSTNREEGWNSVFASILDTIDVYGGERPKKESWYAIYVVPNAKKLGGKPNPYVAHIADSVEMEPCREYWWTGTSAEIWTRTQDPAAC